MGFFGMGKETEYSLGCLKLVVAILWIVGKFLLQYKYAWSRCEAGNHALVEGGFSLAPAVQNAIIISMIVNLIRALGLGERCYRVHHN